MKKQIVAIPHAPAPVGPYSQAIISGDLVFTSGQVAIDPPTGRLIAGDTAAQTTQVLRNLQAILEAAGTDLGHVLKATVFLADMNDFAAMNEVYGLFFGPEPPARTTIEAAKLPLGARVEIDLVARRKTDL